MNKILTLPDSALFFKQPFGSAMFHEKLETRTYPTKKRGLVLICTSKAPYSFGKIASITGKPEIQLDLMAVVQSDETFSLNGYAIGVGYLKDCRRMTIKDEKRAFVKYYPELWVWEFENVRRIEPFPLKGALGFVPLSEEVKKQIEFI